MGLVAGQDCFALSNAVLHLDVLNPVTDNVLVHISDPGDESIAGERQASQIGPQAQVL